MLKIKQALYKPEIQVLHAMHSPHLKGFDAKCKQFFLLSINQLIHYSNKPFNSLCPVHQLFMLTMTNQLRCISIQIFRIHFFFSVTALQRNKMTFKMDKIQNRYLHINLSSISSYFKCYDLQFDCKLHQQQLGGP